MSDLDNLAPDVEAWEQERFSRDPSSHEPIWCSICFSEQLVPATSFCLKCTKYYCDDCWAEQKWHKQRVPGHDRRLIPGIRGENLTGAFRRLERVFQSDIGFESQEHHQQHLNDLETLWLEVTTADTTGDDTGSSSLTFNERPRFEDLMEMHRRNTEQQQGQLLGGNEACYPRLVSFVGTTGAGKSSLISVLLGHLWDPECIEGNLGSLHVPVVGSTTSTIPTSSDIHLYHSPFHGDKDREHPLLFADCEGFGAADVSAAARSRRKCIEEAAPDHNSQQSGAIKKGIDAALNYVKRTIRWSSPNRPKAIKELFPRLVYNISDVVVYVVAEENFRTMGKILEDLVEWSRQAEISSVNNPSRPSLVLLINKCKTAKVKESEWSVDDTMEEILKSNSDLIDLSETFKKRKEELKASGLPHQTIKDILDNSYSAVRLLRLPTDDNMPRLRSQFQRLHSMIDSLTHNAQESKKQTNMLLSSRQLHHLYQLVFDHLSTSTTSPFDFVGAFLAVHKSPPELHSNFFELLVALSKCGRNKDRLSSWQDYEHVAITAAAPLICSTIAMDYHRRLLPGTLRTVFQGGTSATSSSESELPDGSYKATVQRALQEFGDLKFPCGFTFSGSSDKEASMCVNSKTTHARSGTHQSEDGKWFAAGPFDPLYEQKFVEKWSYALETELAGLESVQLSDLWNRHRGAIRALHGIRLDLDLGELPNCVWCMRNLPTERLPCGHWICSSCVVEVGRKSTDDERVTVVELCDQHYGEERFEVPFEFLKLPATVGPRILSLDEGGIRGIFQLDLLDAVQAKLGKDIPLKDCFDLIGGTGVGGINALALGICRWDIANTAARFQEWVPKSFNNRQYHWLGWLGWTTKFKYYSDSLFQAIHDAFGKELDEQLMVKSLSHQANEGSGPTRVFVTSTRQGLGGQVLTNYRRNNVGLDRDKREHSEESQKGQRRLYYSRRFSIGSAAKATASCRPLFGACTVSPGNYQLAGGGEEFACPAEVALLEAQSLWPHLSDYPPEILVSVGCGQSVSKASSKQDDCSGAEAMWTKAFGDKSQKEPDRYIRLCPGFPDGALPKADDVHLLTDSSKLRFARQQIVNQGELDGTVDQVVSKLISTVFYFQTVSQELHGGENEEKSWAVTGHIMCRFKETSAITKAVGKRIASLTNRRFVCGSEDLWTFDDDALRVMQEQGRFRAPQHGELQFSLPFHSAHKMRIDFTADSFPPHSISGGSLLGSGREDKGKS